MKLSSFNTQLQCLCWPVWINQCVCLLLATELLAESFNACLHLSACVSSSVSERVFHCADLFLCVCQQIRAPVVQQAASAWSNLLA